MTEYSEKARAGLDRLLRGCLGRGDQTPRDMPLTPVEAETLAEACDHSISWVRDMPAEDVAEREYNHERIAELHNLRRRLIALHHEGAGS